MKRKILITVLPFLFVYGSVLAQLQVGEGINDFSNRLPEIHNMALVPLTSVPSATLIGGSRLDGFGHHPLNATFYGSGFLIDHLGTGLKVNYDQMGLSSKTDVELGLVYYVFLNKEKSDGKSSGNAGDKFSFSISGHFIQDRLKKNDIVVLDPNDPSLENISETSPNGNASAGIAFLRENKYYFGISAHQLFKSKSAFLNPDFENFKRIHYYMQGSYTFNLSKTQDLDLELLAVGALATFKAYEYEAGFDFKIKKMFTIGAAYRSNGSLKFNVGIIAQSWNFGYAFSYGAWVDATKYSYKGMNNSIFIRKVFNEGRRSKK
jgi:type IX secretion system PorP/SprF family membrane protein